MPKSTYVLTPVKTQSIHYSRTWTPRDTANLMRPIYIRMHSPRQEAANLIATRASWYICKARYEMSMRVSRGLFRVSCSYMQVRLALLGFRGVSEGFANPEEPQIKVFSTLNTESNPRSTNA